MAKLSLAKAKSILYGFYNDNIDYGNELDDELKCVLKAIKVVLEKLDK